MKDITVRIAPKADGGCAAIVPQRALKIGTRLQLPVTMGDAHDIAKHTALCTITEIHREKHWLRCEYRVGKETLHECYHFLTEEG